MLSVARRFPEFCAPAQNCGRLRRTVPTREDAFRMSLLYKNQGKYNMTALSPRQVVEEFIEAFNCADADRLATLYAEDAVNHQVAESPVCGKKAIHEMFVQEFAAAEMTCIVENIFEDGEWSILEWRDPLGLRGCGFFHVVDGKIIFQRGYWDKLSFLRQHKLPLPKE